MMRLIDRTFAIPHWARLGKPTLARIGPNDIQAQFLQGRQFNRFQANPGK